MHRRHRVCQPHPNRVALGVACIGKCAVGEDAAIDAFHEIEWRAEKLRAVMVKYGARHGNAGRVQR